MSETEQREKSITHVAQVETLFTEPTDEEIVKVGAKDKEPWLQRKLTGRVYIKPQLDEHKPQLSLMPTDDTIRWLFDAAAQKVTTTDNDLGGFHQVNAPTLSAWEMSKPVPSEEELLENTKEIMIKLAEDFDR